VYFQISICSSSGSCRNRGKDPAVSSSGFLFPSWKIITIGFDGDWAVGTGASALAIDLVRCLPTLFLVRRVGKLSGRCLGTWNDWAMSIVGSLTPFARNRVYIACDVGVMCCSSLTEVESRMLEEVQMKIWGQSGV
jgi:hypothetical protein